MNEDAATANSKEEGNQSSLNDNHEAQKETKVDKIKEKKKRDSEVAGLSEENTTDGKAKKQKKT